VKELRQDVDVLKVEVKELRQDVDGLKVEVKELRADVDTLKVDVQKLKDEQQSMKVDIQNLKDEQQGMKVLMDVELRREIKLLAEGQELILERLPSPAAQEELEDRVTAVELMVRRHEDQIQELKQAQ
jgi:FtsZ-binding cell division protein ZapB